jgi:hypothetical protein
LPKTDFSIGRKRSSVSKSNITDSGENNILTSAEKMLINVDVREKKVMNVKNVSLDRKANTPRLFLTNLENIHCKKI